jgi:D-galactarolactone cycloisomerase
VEALRAAVGEDNGLMIDLNAGYSRHQAIEALSEWEQYNLLWLEEPLHPNDKVGLTCLREHSRTPLAAGENWFTSEDFAEPIAHGAVAYFMPDAARVGGLSELKRIALMAESEGGIISPHNFSSGILLAATIQIMATLPNAKWLEMDGSNNAVYQELLEEPLWPTEGLVRVPDYPGYGVRLPESIISRDSTERSFTVTL